VNDVAKRLLGAMREVQVDQGEPTRLATVTGGSPLLVQFDGETLPSTRPYTRLSSYAPTVADRVLMLRSGTTWVCVGKIV
jgi:hypothetical protein